MLEEVSVLKKSVAFTFDFDNDDYTNEYHINSIASVG